MAERRGVKDCYEAKGFKNQVGKRYRCSRRELEERSFTGERSCIEGREERPFNHATLGSPRTSAGGLLLECKDYVESRADSEASAETRTAVGLKENLDEPAQRPSPEMVKRRSYGSSNVGGATIICISLTSPLSELTPLQKSLVCYTTRKDAEKVDTNFQLDEVVLGVLDPLKLRSRLQATREPSHGKLWATAVMDKGLSSRLIDGLRRQERGVDYGADEVRRRSAEQQARPRRRPTLN
nr:hypothetical protein HmN_000881900 [Hymenolepis microstoma]